MAHFNWTRVVSSVTDENFEVATSLVAAVVIIALALLGRLSLGRGKEAVTPAGSFSLKGILEILTEFMVGLTDMVIGEHGRKYVPMFAALFFYIWVSNLMGLIPGMTPPTDSINTTFALGLCSFVVYNIMGLKENGVGYLKHFFGPVAWLAPLIFVIELISHVMRPLTLGLRLKGNITADHTVISIFLDLVPFGVPAIFYGMGLFVASMQAFVFTILSMVYVSMATAHDH